MTARLFELYRHADVSGVSGTGVVAEGVEFADGGIALRWKGEHPATSVWPSMASLLAVHGHEGQTVARYLGGEDQGYISKTIAAMQQGMSVAGVYNNILNGRPRLEVQVNSNVWCQWIDLFGGSLDDAVATERSTANAKYHWELRWTSPDESLACFCLSAASTIPPVGD